LAELPPLFAKFTPLKPDWYVSSITGRAVTTTVIRPCVLVVDDAAFNREVLVQNLEDEYEMLEAADGVAAVVIARAQLPDVILMDLSLPGIDGWEAVRLLRRDPATAWIPIVAVTAHAMAGDKSRALASGCDDYLPKPVDEELLQVKVRYWLARGRQRRPPSQGCD
jgi:two-component system, cell cycle response regulator DivK